MMAWKGVKMAGRKTASMARRVVSIVVIVALLSALVAGTSACRYFISETQVARHIEKLLEEKYDRQFEVTYVWSSGTQEVGAEVHEQGHDDLLFQVRIKVSNGTIKDETMRDDFAGRRLCRQAEDLAIEVFARHGIEIMSLCMIPSEHIFRRQTDTDPDMLLEDFMKDYDDSGIVFFIVIRDTVPSPKTNKDIESALWDLYYELDYQYVIHIYPITERGFKDACTYLRTTAEFRHQRITATDQDIFEKEFSLLVSEDGIIPKEK